MKTTNEKLTSNFAVRQRKQSSYKDKEGSYTQTDSVTGAFEKGKNYQSLRSRFPTIPVVPATTTAAAEKGSQQQTSNIK